MAEIDQPFLPRRVAEDEEEEASEPVNSSSTVVERIAARLSSLDVFRGLCVFVIFSFFLFSFPFSLSFYFMHLMTCWFAKILLDCVQFLCLWPDQ